MNLRSIVYGAFAAGAGLIIAALPSEVNSLSSGAPAGNTGSPGDGATCITSCHSSNPGNGNQNEVTTITHDVPATGYVPGVTYNFSLNMDGVGTEKFGFSLSPQNANGDGLGTLIAGTNNYVVGGGDYLTHTFASTQASDSQTWDFQWTAPAAGTGMVTFYASSLYANNNNNNQGDYEVLAESAVMEATGVGLEEVQAVRLTSFPNPVNGRLWVEGAIPANASFTLMDMTGKTLQSGTLNPDRSIDLDRARVDQGVYMLRLKHETTESITKILVD